MTTSDDFTVRPAEAHDMPALGRLGALLVRSHHEFDSQRFFAASPGLESGYGQFLASQLDQPDVGIFVAELGGAVIGYVYAGIEPHSWKELRDTAGFIHDVAVDPAQRRRGVGTALVQAAATWLEDRGAPRLMLWSAEQNRAAQRMFERLGFRRTMVEMTRETTR